MTAASDLCTSDLAMFGRFGVNADLLLEAGVRRVTDAEAREFFAGNNHGDLAGLMFPYADPETGHQGTCRIRRDHPEMDPAGKPDKKYLMPYGDPPHIYFAPGAGAALADVTVPVVLEESEKAAMTTMAAARRAGRPILVIALGGCHGWRTGRAGKAVDAAGARVNVTGPQPDLARVAWPGRDTVILFDSNTATNFKVRHARRQLADELASRGARVRIGTVPIEPDVNGPDDYRAAHDDAALLALLDNAVPIQPATVDELLEDCGALGLTSPVDASQVEPVIRSVQVALRGADALRVSAVRSKLVSLLKDRGLRDAGRLVDSAIGAKSDPAATDAPFLADVEPWPDPVDGAVMLNDVVALLRNYMVLPARAVEAIALWCLQAFLMTVWSTSPILAVLSPVKRCGKSTLMELVQVLVPRGLLVSNLSTSSLFRVVEAFSPTLLSDEADSWLSDETSELRGVFNSGWRRGTAKVLRCDGDDHEPTIFSTWAPKSIAAIGKLPGTIEDRSIVVQLRRKTAAEAVARFRHDRVEAEALPLRRQLRRWADDHAAVVARLDPDDLDELHDRASDNWRPLRTLAAALGADWPARADASALALSGVTAEADDNIGVQLLGDIKTVFEDKAEDALPSSMLALALAELTDRPWAEWSHGKPITTNKLARLLAPFGVAPANVRIGAKVPKSYTRHAFCDAWDRYLPPDVGSKPLHRNKLNEYGPESSISKPLQAETCSGLKSENTSMNTGVCYGVAVQTPESGPGDGRYVFEEGQDG